MNPLKNIGLQDNSNCLTPQQIEQVGEILPDSNSISVLEFGAGRSSVIIFNALKKKYKNVTYVTYETNAEYAPTEKGITVRMHSREELRESTISIPKNEKYDLVIVDGPDGEDRRYWYPIFVNNVKNETVIHIDDAFHFVSFEHDFLISFPLAKIQYEHGRGTNRGKCWITATIDSEQRMSLCKNFKPIRTLSLILSTVLMLFARLLKVACISIAPPDTKQGFRDNI